MGSLGKVPQAKDKLVGALSVGHQKRIMGEVVITDYQRSCGIDGADNTTSVFLARGDRHKGSAWIDFSAPTSNFRVLAAIS